MEILIGPPGTAKSAILAWYLDELFKEKADIVRPDILEKLNNDSLTVPSQAIINNFENLVYIRNWHKNKNRRMYASSQIEKIMNQYPWFKTY